MSVLTVLLFGSSTLRPRQKNPCASCYQIIWSSPCGVVANVLDYHIVVSEFE